MKNKKLLRSFDLVDEKYLEEAVEATPKKKSVRFRVIKWGSIAASLLAVAVIFNVIFLKPYDDDGLSDIEQHADSEYYPVIEKLNELTYNPPQHKNLLQQLWRGLSNGGLKGEVSADDMMAIGVDNEIGMAPGASVLENGTGSYEEVTDNQVAGVTEADRIKRTDKHIYYLHEHTLYVYSIAGEDTAFVGSYKFSDFNKNGYFNDWEFYLSKDCKTITVVAPHYSEERDTGVVSLISLDVTEPTNITEKGRATVTGGHISTRVKDGKILLMTNFRVQFKNGKPDFSDEFSFIPSIDKGNGFELLPMADIITPETLSSARYTVICKLDEATLGFEDAAALMSYSEEVYVSLDKIFATYRYTKSEKNDNVETGKVMTDVSVLSYNELEMKYLGGVTLEGYVKDQYSLDEYDGMLRVVTTTEATLQRVYGDGDSSAVEFESLGTSANLYCVSLENYEIISSVVGFAPKGESVRSVRFDGEDAYVCTAIQLTDPVFFFDLSDVSNITYKETGTIEGFSTSLVNFGNGYLLGIGVGDSWGSLKIEVYEEGKDGVDSVCAYEIENAYYSDDYKSYYINRDKQMVGLGVEVYSDDKHSDEYPEKYIVVRFDGYGIYEIVNVELPGTNQYKRGVYIDGYMYMFSGDAFVVEYIG